MNKWCMEVVRVNAVGVRWRCTVRVENEQLHVDGHTPEALRDAVVAPYGALGLHVGSHWLCCDTVAQLRALSDAVGIAHADPAASWMAALPDAVRQRPWTALVLPATHDSAAYVLPASTSWLPLLADWALCQSVPVHQQLAMGVRCLDLRVARHDDGVLWCVHRARLVPLLWVLLEVRRFLVHQAGELVMLRIKAGWEQRASMDAAALVQLQTLLELALDATRLVPPGLVVPLPELTAAGHQCVCVWEGDGEPAPGSPLWPRTLVAGHWANVNAVPLLRARIEEHTAGWAPVPVDPRVMREVSFTLTPTAADVQAAAGRMLTLRARSSLRHLATLSAALLLEMAPTLSRGRFAIVSVDHVTPAVVQCIVALNNGVH